MRFRIVYLFSFVLSAVAMYFFRSDLMWMNLISSLSGILIKIGLVLSICFILMTIMGSGASLHRTRKLSRTILKTIFWIVFTGLITLVLSYIGQKLVFNVSDFSLSLGDASLLSQLEIADVPDFKAFTTLFSNSQFVFIGLFVAFILFLIFSNFLNPTLKVIQPAYALANSFSEVGFRFFYAVCDIYIVFLFIISGAFFIKVFNPESSIRTLVASNTDLMIHCAIFFGALCIIVFPILFLIFSGFRKNPFPVIWSALITSLVSVFSGDLLFSVPVMEEIHRHQNNSLKRTTIISGNIQYFFSRIGSASLAYILIVSLSAASGAEFDIVNHAILMGLCFGFSLVSGIFPGLEYIFIIVGVKLVMPQMVSDDIVTISAGYLPIFALVGLFVDTFTINFGTKTCDLPIKVSSEDF